jgi:hypothetical protein
MAIMARARPFVIGIFAECEIANPAFRTVLPASRWGSAGAPVAGEAAPTILRATIEH